MVVSTGWTVMDDLKAFEGDADIIAVKEIGMTIFPCRHWFSCHMAETEGWELVRAAMARQVPTIQKPVMHGKQGGRWLPWPIDGSWGRDSGQSAAIVACLLGYDEITLAGMPCDGGGHNYPWKINEAHEPVESYLRGWVRLRDEFFRGKVKSLSGNTRDVLSTV